MMANELGTQEKLETAENAAEDSMGLAEKPLEYFKTLRDLPEPVAKTVYKVS